MITQNYPVGVKRQIMHTIAPMFGVNYPDPEYANKIAIRLEWPEAREQLPSIYLTYGEGTIHNVGLGHYETGLDSEGLPILYKHYMFDGTINFNVLALSPLERDRVAAGLINILSFSDITNGLTNLKVSASDGQYVYFVLNPEEITPRGESANPVPWGNEDEQIFTNTYSVKVHGEFYSNPQTGQLVEIDSVQVYPYRPEESPPW